MSQRGLIVCTVACLLAFAASIASIGREVGWWGAWW